MGKTALFVIDIQDELALDPKTRIPDASRICEAGTELLKRARWHIEQSRQKEIDPELQIVFVQHEETTPEGTLIRDTKPWELVFEPQKDDALETLVQKTTQNTFQSNPDLASLLKSQGVSALVAFGIQSEYCVGETSKGALAAGFDVTLLQGAHSTYDADGKKATDIEKEIDEQLEKLGAKLLPWQRWYP